MYKKILVATDMLDQNSGLLDKAKQLAEQNGAELTLVTVVEPLPSYGYTYVGSADVEATLIEESKSKLKALGDQLGVPAERQIVDIGPTKTEIVRIANETQADLILIGSHGHHGLSHLIGSTANGVLHHAECDVLVVRLR